MSVLLSLLRLTLSFLLVSLIISIFFTRSIFMFPWLPSVLYISSASLLYSSAINGGIFCDIIGRSSGLSLMYSPVISSLSASSYDIFSISVDPI